MAKDLGIELLAQIPIVQGICESGDTGNPVAFDKENEPGKAFNKLAARVVELAEKRNAEMEPTKKVEITTK